MVSIYSAILLYFNFSGGFFMTQQERDELMRIVRELSYEEREVTLASGRKSNFYFDGKQTCLHARGGLLVGKAFWQEVKLTGRAGARRRRTDAGRRSHRHRHLHRRRTGRAGGTRLHHPQGTEGTWHRSVAGGAQEPSPGSRVVIVEDVTTTGGSSMKAVERGARKGSKSLASSPWLTGRGCPGCDRGHRSSAAGGFYPLPGSRINIRQRAQG
jgi:orotate phosphoribosyltransferase